MAKNLAIKDHRLELRIYSRRILLSLLVILSLLGILVGRYYNLQVVQHERFTTMSERNRVHVQPIPPNRGLIFDRNDTLIAENQPSYSLVIVLERVDDLEQTLAALKSIITITDNDVEKFRKRSRGHRPYEAIPLRFRLNEQEIAKLAVNSYRLPGVKIEAQLMRHYPYGNLFAHTIGYVGRINERDQQRLDPIKYSGTHSTGKTGLEKQYESFLLGEVGYQHVETNARGRVLRILERTDPEPGMDLKLHLDLYLQRVAHQAFAGRRGAVVAIEVSTGGVLAAVSAPSFDANLFVTGISSKAYRGLRDSDNLPLFNRLLQGQYPPGSTVKPMIGLAGLEYGTVTPDTTVYDPGYYILPNDTRHYRDWKKGGHGSRINLRTAIAQSCDIYFYDLAYKMGIDKIHEFGGYFGLGIKTGVDLPGERQGLLPSRAWKRANRRLPWFPGETLNVGIGQGDMLTTPMQLAVMTATLASRGQRQQPSLVKSVTDNGEDIPVPVKQLSPVPINNLKNWDHIYQGMADVTHGTRGTARRIGMNAPYKMAGKTGTAQVIGIKQGEEYDAEKTAERNRDHALFVGFAPLEAPQIAVAVIVENGEHGSSTAAPIARQLFDAYLVPPPVESTVAMEEANDG